MKKLIPADTVDAAGNVWETTGENIRNGVREISERDVKMLVNVLFPIGSVYCGENSFVLSVGKWSLITASDWYPIYLGEGSSSGTILTQTPEYSKTGSTARGVALRMWKRVS